MSFDEAWHPVGRATRRECPLCDWYAEEPPRESRTIETEEGWRFEIRQHSALAHGLIHILTEHRDSAQAAEIRRWVIEQTENVARRYNE